MIRPPALLPAGEQGYPPGCGPQGAGATKDARPQDCRHSVLAGKTCLNRFSPIVPVYAVFGCAARMARMRAGVKGIS